MAKEKKYNEDYLNGLIKKAKKSWEGVDVDSFMLDLRDDSFDKEVAEELSKKVTSYITEQIKSNMNIVTIKCQDLMIGDWVLINNTPHKIQAIDSIDTEVQADDELYYVGEDRYHSEDKVEGIPLTPEILEKNEWKRREIFMDIKVTDTTIFSWTDMYGESLFQNGYHMCDCKYVHTLQHAFRLYGFNELVDNFKI